MTNKEKSIETLNRLIEEATKKGDKKSVENFKRYLVIAISTKD